MHTVVRRAEGATIIALTWTDPEHGAAARGHLRASSIVDRAGTQVQGLGNRFELEELVLRGRLERDLGLPGQEM
jgi:hypothetical protein